ncbi:MAG: 3-phosphoshikimate 1-carboxyvinyltransferase [Polyangia bacterium]
MKKAHPIETSPQGPSPQGAAADPEPPGVTDGLAAPPQAPCRLRIRPGAPLRGRIAVPGDKSISHRAVLLGALAEGTTRVRGFLAGADCRATVQAVRALGVAVRAHGGDGPGPVLEPVVEIAGVGKHGLREPAAVLDCQNSGTTMRLLAGLLAGQRFTSFLSGTPQLCRRPMARVVTPLREMGALIVGRQGGRMAPLGLHGALEQALRGVTYRAPIASAQVKSALLLAGLYADGPVVLHEAGPSRDHTERMLAAMLTAPALERDGGVLRLDGRRAERLRPLELTVPGDASSAAFILAAAAVVPGSDVTVTGVGTNPTRAGFLDAMRAMGADLTVEHPREQGGEPVADVRLRHRPLRGLSLGGPDIVRLVDELPVLAVVATQAAGRTEVRDAAELRVKETDRIAATVATLAAFRAAAGALEDGFVIEGPVPLAGAALSSLGDHRIAMAATVAALCADGESLIDRTEVTADSFPGFAEALCALGADVTAAGPLRRAAEAHE